MDFSKEEMERLFKYADEVHRKNLEAIAGQSRTVVDDDGGDKSSAAEREFIPYISACTFRLFNFTEESKVRPKQEICPSLDSERCRCPSSRTETVFQVLDLKIVEPRLGGDKATVFGFVAVRDGVDFRRNYVFNRAEKDAVKVSLDQEGSAKLPMTLPKRAINGGKDVVVEYDVVMRNDFEDREFVWKGYDVVTTFRYVENEPSPYHGLVEFKFVCISDAVEASVEIKPVKVHPDGLRLRLTAISGRNMPDNEIVVYDQGDTISPEDIKDGEKLSKLQSELSFVIGVALHDQLLLNFRLNGNECSTAFQPTVHGASVKEIEDDCGNKLSIRISWSPPYPPSDELISMKE